MSGLRTHRPKSTSIGFVNGTLDLDETEVLDISECKPQHKPNHGSAYESSPRSSPRATSSRKSKPPAPQILIAANESKEVLLTGIFTVDGRAYDINLYSSSLVLTTMNGKSKGDYLYFISTSGFDLLVVLHH